ncbi:MAG: DUF493 domain-containing protein [Gammaproteobacteria bacterium]|jgi:putative lipoic acid-binding regulatory protein
MVKQDPPKLVYPCPYPIKVLGEHSEDFASVIISIVQLHDPLVREEHVTVRASGQGRYAALTITITAQGPEHIQALFEDLKASGRVSVVL